VRYDNRSIEDTGVHYKLYNNIILEIVEERGIYDGRKYLEKI
jgi:hypothetical protein